MYNFSGKKAVVTGAAQGLGKSIALRLLEDGAEGVALLDLKADALEQAASALDPSGDRKSVV